MFSRSILFENTFGVYLSSPYYPKTIFEKLTELNVLKVLFLVILLKNQTIVSAFSVY